MPTMLPGLGLAVGGQQRTTCRGFDLTCRAYKIRDILEEMHLDGVVPNVDTYFRAMFASMQARRLGDALFFWEDMRKHGILADVSPAAILILSQPQSETCNVCQAVDVCSARWSRCAAVAAQVQSYGVIISAAGRANQPDVAMKVCFLQKAAG